MSLPSTEIHSPGGHRLREPQSWLPRAWRICALLLFVVVLSQFVVLLAALGQIGSLAAEARAKAERQAGLEAAAQAAAEDVRQCTLERERLIRQSLEMARQCNWRATIWESDDAR